MFHEQSARGVVIKTSCVSWLEMMIRELNNWTLISTLLV